MSYQFHPGMRVVCVDDKFSEGGTEILPKRDEVYTIRDIEIIGDTAFVRTIEIVNEPRRYREAFSEMCFDARAFRPVVTRPTSIECFRQLLTSPKVDA